MPDTAESILKRLQRDGSSAQELLPVYQDPAHETLRRQNPELYRAGKLFFLLQQARRPGAVRCVQKGG
jgi:hypothetical protein